MDRWWEVPKVFLNPWHKAGDVEVVYHKSPYVVQCGKVVQDVTVEPLWGNFVAVGPTDPECLDEGKQAKSVHTLETITPLKFSFPGVADEEIVMEVRDSSNVPGVTGQGACEEAAYVVGKIGDDNFDNFQRKFCGRGLRGNRRDP